MNLKQIQSQERPFRVVSGPPDTLHRRAGRSRLWERALSRRQFLHTAMGATGLVLGAGLVSPARADGCADPRPIPGGLDILGTGEIFHLRLPGYPGFGMDPATNDASVITDFNGQIGLSYIRGMGTHTDLATGAISHLPFEVDLRFMKGEFVGLDGRHHHGAFALV